MLQISFNEHLKTQSVDSDGPGCKIFPKLKMLFYYVITTVANTKKLLDIAAIERLFKKWFILMQIACLHDI